MIRISVRIAIGLVFIVSGIAKLYPIEPFELIFVDAGVANFLTAPFVARLLIAIELFFGLSIIFKAWLKQLIYYGTQAFLALFMGYLVFIWITQGSDADCGCFGSWLSLTPLESIAKNVLLMAGLLWIKKKQTANQQWWLVLVFVVVALATPFLLNRVGLHNVQGVEVNQKVDFSDLPSLYQSGVKVDFTQGKKTVAFFTWTCPHCINAARKLVSMNKQQEMSNLYLVIGAKEEAGLKTFNEKTKNNFPTIWINDDTFFKYSGGRLPAIVCLENGTMKKKWFGELFDADELKACLGSE